MLIFKVFLCIIRLDVLLFVVYMFFLVGWYSLGIIYIDLVVFIVCICIYIDICKYRVIWVIC